jgi:hypothetical protein
VRRPAGRCDGRRQLTCVRACRRGLRNAAESLGDVRPGTGVGSCAGADVGARRNCHGFILVYSITQRSSFMRLERYYNDMMRTKRGAPKFILVGNKVDKNQQREVSTVEGHQKAIAWGCKFFETSAKTRHNVEDAFTRIVRELRETDKEKPEAAGTKTPTTKKPSRWSKCVIL